MKRGFSVSIGIKTMADYSFDGKVSVETDATYCLNGSEYTDRDFILLAGAPDGAVIRVQNYEIITEHRQLFESDMRQIIYEDADDALSLYLYLDLLAICEKYRNQNLATEILKRQIIQARKLGFKELSLNAQLDGYYFWPSRGFNADIPQGVCLPDFLLHCHDIADIMQIPWGKQWWNENRFVDTLPMTFDLSDGSKSMCIFERFMTNREYGNA